MLAVSGRGFDFHRSLQILKGLPRFLPISNIKRSLGFVLGLSLEADMARLPAKQARHPAQRVHMRHRHPIHGTGHMRMSIRLFKHNERMQPIWGTLGALQPAKENT
jgi:hypothetical protein